MFTFQVLRLQGRKLALNLLGELPPPYSFIVWQLKFMWNDIYLFNSFGIKRRTFWKTFIQTLFCYILVRTLDLIMPAAAIASAIGHAVFRGFALFMVCRRNGREEKAKAKASEKEADVLNHEIEAMRRWFRENNLEKECFNRPYPTSLPSRQVSSSANLSMYRTRLDSATRSRVLEETHPRCRVSEDTTTMSRVPEEHHSVVSVPPSYPLPAVPTGERTVPRYSRPLPTPLTPVSHSHSQMSLSQEAMTDDEALAVEAFRKHYNDQKRKNN